MIGGVSGGLAEYTGVDALLWRVGFVAVTLAWGVGLIVYPLLWLLMPAAPVDPTAQVVRAQRAPAGPRSPVPGITLAVVLILVGIGALLSRFTDIDLGARAFLGGALQGEFGRSLNNNRPVLGEILGRLPATLELAAFSILGRALMIRCSAS